MNQTLKKMVIIVSIFFLFLISLIFLIRPNHRRLPLPPGPIGWPLFGNLFQLGLNPHQTLKALSISHGSDGLLRIRLGTVNVVVILSASAASNCFRNHDASLSGRPPNSVGKHIAYNSQDLIMAPYGGRWKMLRKLCSVHLFSNKALEGFRHVRDEELVRLVRSLAIGRDEVVDVGGMVNTCVIEILARVLLGRRVVAGGEEAAEFKEIAVEMTRLGGQFNVGDFLPMIDFLDLQGLNKKMSKIRERFGEYLEKIIEEHRLKGTNDAEDFLSVLMNMNEGADEKYDELTSVNIKALLQDMFIAGTDTTAITIEWTLAELLRHPNILIQAQNELDSVVGLNNLVSESDLPKLPFLHSIIKETFRLHPPVPLSVPRMATQNCEINGYLIPKGTYIFLNIWAIGRDQTSYPNDTCEFNPYRFYFGSAQENIDVKGNDFELVPFGLGRRRCVGMNLGLRIVKLVIAMLLHSFDWVLPIDGDRMLNMEESFGATLRKTKPLMVKVVPRLASQAYL